MRYWRSVSESCNTTPRRFGMRLTCRRWQLTNSARRPSAAMNARIGGNNSNGLPYGPPRTLPLVVFYLSIFGYWTVVTTSPCSSTAKVRWH